MTSYYGLQQRSYLNEQRGLSNSKKLISGKLLRLWDITKGVIYSHLTVADDPTHNPTVNNT